MTSPRSFSSTSRPFDDGERISTILSSEHLPARPSDTPRPDEPTEPRGFALYVGISESSAQENGLELIAIVDALRTELARRVPTAESHALAVLAPANASPRNLEVVMRALGEHAPASKPSAASHGRSPEEKNGVVIDFARHHVLVDGGIVHLTFKEFALLQAFARHDGTVLSRRYLKRVIADEDRTEISDRAIDVHVRRLRVKFGAYPDLIRTVHGHGYRFDQRRDVVTRWASAPSPDLI